MIARSMKERVPYIPKCDRGLPEDQRTTFYLATLNSNLGMAVVDLMSSTPKLGAVLALKAGLRGWDRFPDEQGNQTPFARDSGRKEVVPGVWIENPVADSSLDVIPVGILYELAEAIVQANTATVADAKN